MAKGIKFGILTRAWARIPKAQRAELVRVPVRVRVK